MQPTPTRTLFEIAGPAEGWVLPDPDAACAGAAVIQPFRPHAAAFEKMGIAVSPALEGSYASLHLLPPKEMDWAKALVAECLDRLKPGGLLALAAANDAGGRRWPKLLSGYFALESDVSKNHQRVVSLRRPENIPPEVAAWRDLSMPRVVPGTPLLSAAGMFSHGEIDPGSALLAGCFSDLRGKVADLGAGWGYLSWAALQKSSGISRIDLYEADARARALAEKNVPGQGYFWHDVTGASLRDAYDTIITNPPFHLGKKTDPGLGQAFIARAAAHLRPGGDFWLVANRRLPYEDVLRDKFSETRLIAEDLGFKVYRSMK